MPSPPPSSAPFHGPLPSVLPASGRSRPSIAAILRTEYHGSGGGLPQTLARGLKPWSYPLFSRGGGRRVRRGRCPGGGGGDWERREGEGLEWGRKEEEGEGDLTVIRDYTNRQWMAEM